MSKFKIWFLSNIKIIIPITLTIAVATTVGVVMLNKANSDMPKQNNTDTQIDTNIKADDTKVKEDTSTDLDEKEDDDIRSYVNSNTNNNSDTQNKENKTNSGTSTNNGINTNSGSNTNTKTNTGSDTTSPVIQDFNIASSSINAPGKVKVTVRIADDISGVQWVRVFYYNPSKTQQLCAHLSKTSNDVWEGYLEFNNYSESGTYTLWEIIAADNAGNQVDIYDNKLPSNYSSKTIVVTN